MELREVGTTINKQGGLFVVIAHINCERCETLIEEREVLRPHSKEREKRMSYSWCHECGLYSRVIKK